MRAHFLTFEAMLEDEEVQVHIQLRKHTIVEMTVWFGDHVHFYMYISGVSRFMSHGGPY